MKKILPLGFLLLSTSTFSAPSWVSNAKITKVEFYGSQFTVHLDKPHSSSDCGHTGAVVALDPSSDPGKAHYSFFLMAYASQKSVSVRVTDAVCSGDRPTILQIQGH
jgi:hypothetical protein